MKVSLNISSGKETVFGDPESGCGSEAQLGEQTSRINVCV